MMSKGNSRKRELILGFMLLEGEESNRGKEAKATGGRQGYRNRKLGFHLLSHKQAAEGVHWKRLKGLTSHSPS